jgi:hypothetical protein
MASVEWPQANHEAVLFIKTRDNHRDLFIKTLYEALGHLFVAGRLLQAATQLPIPVYMSWVLVSVWVPQRFGLLTSSAAAPPSLLHAAEPAFVPGSVTNSRRPMGFPQTKDHGLSVVG